MRLPASLRSALAGPAGFLLLIAAGIGLLAAVPEVAFKMRTANLLRGAYPEDWPLPGWRDRAGFERTRVAMPGLALTMPKFFVVRTRPDPADGTGQRAGIVEIEIRLPGFQPYGPNSQQEYAERPLDRLYIELIASERAPTPEERIERLVATGRHAPLVPVADGAVHAARKTDRDDWAYAYRDGRGYTMLAVCDRMGAGDLCTASFPLRPNVLVEYRFARQPHLKDWPTIDAKVRALVESFAEP
jgi:hypothetical protein